MRIHLYFLGLLLGFARALPAQDLMPDTAMTRSLSGEFIVMKRQAPLGSSRVTNPGANGNFIRLDASLVPVSCERVKQALQRELENPAPAKGKVYILLTPAVSLQDEIELSSEAFRDGWHYRINLPDLIDRAQYVRAIVQVCLQEMADRKPGSLAVELPAWLIDGFTRRVLSSSEMAILLPPPGPVTGDSRPRTTLFKYKPLEKAHDELLQHLPLTFEELSWPRGSMTELSGQRVYAFSAELFVVELCHLPGGRASLRHMVETLPEYYNWQFAFLEAFKQNFNRPRDVEKWWALRCAHFIGRGLDQIWPVPESVEKLREAVRPPVQVRAGTNDIPLHTDVALQTVLREWNGPREKSTLTNVVSQLRMLHSRLAPELTGLAQQYESVLLRYLDSPNKKILALPFSARKRGRDAVIEAVKQLDLLDLQLADFNPTGATVSSAQLPNRGLNEPPEDLAAPTAAR